MNRTRAFIFGLSTILSAPGALAAGFQLNEFSVAAMGRANAGEPAMADTAATIARNSAAMGNFDEATVSIVYHYIDPEIDVEGTVTTPNPLISDNADAYDIAPGASVPGLYYIQPINDQWAVGLSLNSYYGLSTDYGNNYSATEFAQKTSIKTYYLTPHVSFKPVDNLTLALGVSYIYGEGIIKNSATAINNAIAGVPDGTTLLDLDGDGDAFGYTVGMLWNINEATRLGLRYQSRVNLDMEGDMQLFVNPPGAVMNFTGVLTINLPEVYELGLVHDLSERVTLSAGLQKTGWHVFKDLTAKIDGVGSRELKKEDWQDAWRYSLGVDFRTTDMLTLRAGYGYDESPVKEGMRHLSIPDADRNWYTIGASFNLGASGSIDTAFAYLDGGSAKVTESSALASNFNGKLSSTKAYIYSIGYNISF